MSSLVSQKRRTRSSTAFRYFLFDNRQRKFLEIKNGSICGRFDGDIKFPSDDLISRRQCQFTIIGNEIYLEDFGSTNPTRVNTVSMQAARRRRVRLDDVIEIGEQRFILTAQNRYPPGNTEDLLEGDGVFKGLKKSDGSLTVNVTGMFTKQTLLRLNRQQFVKLRIKKDVRRLSSRFASIWSGLGTLLLGISTAYGLSSKSEISRASLVTVALSAVFAGLWHLFVVQGISRRGVRIAVAFGSIAVISIGSVLAAQSIKIARFSRPPKEMAALAAPAESDTGTRKPALSSGHRPLRPEL